MAFDKTAPFLVTTLRRLVDDETLPNCKATFPHCDDKVLARFMCPETCGCTVPQSGLWQNSEGGGCDPTCLHASLKWDVLPCDDVAQNELQESDEWQRVVKHASNSIHNLVGDEFMPNFLNSGCAMLKSMSSFLRGRLCRGDGVGSAGLAD